MGTPKSYIEEQDLETQIERFTYQSRRRIGELINENVYVADLMKSFPAIVYALGTCYGSERDRRETLRLINEGKSLRVIADAIGLPYWLRKAPPEAFQYRLQSFKGDEDFQRQLAGAFPTQINAMARWLFFVPQAVHYCDQDFALWLAWQNVFEKKSEISEYDLYRMALFAWYSKYPHFLAGSLIDRGWNPNIQFSGVRKLTRLWFRKMLTELWLGPDEVRASWLKPGRVGSYSFEALTRGKDLRIEGRQMRNCVELYAQDIAGDRCRLFGIRKKGKHVGTLEIRCHGDHEGRPTIYQLLAPKNEEASEALWRATFKWLSTQMWYRIPSKRFKPKLSRKVWGELWYPYWKQMGKTDFLSDDFEVGMPEILKGIAG